MQPAMCHLGEARRYRQRNSQKEKEERGEAGRGEEGEGEEVVESFLHLSL